jgi:hypothetical protein
MIHRNLIPIGLMSIIGLIALLIMTQPPPAQSANTLEDYPNPSPTIYVIPTISIDGIVIRTPIISETPSKTPSETPSETPSKTPSETPTIITSLTQPTTSLDTQVQTPTVATDAPVIDPVETAPPEILRCSPNAVHLMSGRTTPDTQLLLKFGTRVVGGGTSDGTGFFAIPLKMGKEPQGDYTISVVTRIKNVVVATLPCVVP